jgi:hypothetical protein
MFKLKKSSQNDDFPELASLTRKLHAYRVFRPERVSAMDRLSEKFAKAGGVVARVTKHFETRLDELIAREDPAKGRLDRAVDSRHKLIDQHLADLDGFEKQAALLENADPFADGEAGGPPGHNRSV